MNVKSSWIWIVVSLLAGMVASTAVAKPNWRMFVPFESRVEWDERKDYRVHEGNGPWMILAASFAGDGGEQQARELIKELRTRFNMQAYLWRQVFDYTQTMRGKGVGVTKMRYHHDGKVDQFAVLVGNFDSVEHPEIESVLTKIKYAQPKALELRRDQAPKQRLAVFREIQRRIHPDQDRRKRGPMAAAFVTRNPLLPKEYFRPSGMDTFVYNLNKNIQYSLLKNPGKYSVRVATFRGSTVIGDSSKFKITGKLDEAASKAHRLTEALRKKRVEAYEFHDRHESYVTIGSFNTVGEQLPNGKTNLHPQIHNIMESYGPIRTPVGRGEVGLRPRDLNSIPFDLQPIPVKVPKASIAVDYAAAGR